MEFLLWLFHVSPSTGIQVQCGWEPKVLHNKYIEKAQQGSDSSVLYLSWTAQQLPQDTPCWYYSPKANQATKKTFPLNDANLVTHLLCMGLAKWQTWCNFMENATPVSTRALLLVLENIENNTELDRKPPNVIKANGAWGKCKIESIGSCISKKPKNVG